MTKPASEARKRRRQAAKVQGRPPSQRAVPETEITVEARTRQVQFLCAHYSTLVQRFAGAKLEAQQMNIEQAGAFIQAELNALNEQLTRLESEG